MCFSNCTLLGYDRCGIPSGALRHEKPVGHAMFNARSIKSQRPDENVSPLAPIKPGYWIIRAGLATATQGFQGTSR
jgi:hypothetical protein